MIDLVTKISNCGRVKTYAGGLDGAALDGVIGRGICLPLPHCEFLKSSNGITVYDGYYRLFGIGPGSCVDSILWNQTDVWKFAWTGRADEYWCFGETAWGDQYAYRIEDLKRGNGTVFFLDMLSMHAQELAHDFREFIESDFLRNAKRPYDEVLYEVHKRRGVLDERFLIAYSPSIHLGAKEDPNNVIAMPRRAAMIVNADIAIQVDRLSAGSEITGVEPYQDELGRPRVQLVTRQ